MCSSAECVPSLLDTGAGSVLATLASSSDPEMLLGGCQALANMLACMAEEAGTVAAKISFERYKMTMQSSFTRTFQRGQYVIAL